MNTLGKIGILLIAVIAAGLAGLYLYLTPERIRELVVPEIESALNRKVAVRDVSLSVWGGIGANLSGLRIDDRAGFGTDPFVSAESGELSISLVSLILGRDEIGDLTIKDPVIRIVVDEKGESNYADILAQGESAESGGSPPILPITRFLIENGSMIQDDRQTRSVTRLEGIDYQVDLNLTDGTLELDGRLEVGSMLLTDLDGVESSLDTPIIAHKIALMPAADMMRIDRLDLDVGALGIAVTGTVTELSRESPSLDLKIHERSETISYVEADLSASGILDIALSIVGRYEPLATPPVLPTTQGYVKLTDLTAKTPDLLQPVTNGVISIDFSADQVTLREFSASMGGSDIRITGSLGHIEGLLFPGSARPSLRFELASQNLDLDELLPVAPQEQASTGAFYFFSTPLYAAVPPGDLTSPIIPLLQSMDVGGTIAIARFVSGGTLTDLSADVSSRLGKVSVSDIAASVYGGKLSGSVEADLSANQSLYPASVSMSVKGGQADGVLQNFFDLPLPVVGILGLNISGSGRVDSTLTFLTKTLDMSGQGNVDDGEIVNWGWLKGAAGGLAQLSFVDFDRIPIQNVTTHIQVKDGKLFTRDLKMTAAEIPCALNGSTDLSDGTLDYTVDLDLPADRLSVGGVNVGKALGSFLGQPKDSKKTVIPLQIRIGGLSSDPKLSVTVKQTEGSSNNVEETGRSLLNRFRNR